MTEQAAEPTMESFMDSIGDPDFSFSIPNEGTDIPKGGMDCCRVTHQVGCASHVAGCIVGIAFKVRRPSQPDLDLTERLLVQGDVLADLDRLDATVRSIWAAAAARAGLMKGTIPQAAFHVYCLSADQQKQFDYLQDRSRDEALGARTAEMAAADETPTHEIEQMEVVFLPDEEYEGFLERADTMPAEGYAHRVAVVPGEVGHDDTRRYVLQSVWEASDATFGVQIP